MTPIAIKLDVTKIRKEWLFAGKSGKYVDLFLHPKDTPDQYGNDWMVTQSPPKEERQRGTKGPIVGNGRNIEGRQKPTTKPTQAKPTADNYNPETDDVPF